MIFFPKLFSSPQETQYFCRFGFCNLSSNCLMVELSFQFQMTRLSKALIFNIFFPAPCTGSINIFCPPVRFSFDKWNRQTGCGRRGAASIMPPAPRAPMPPPPTAISQPSWIQAGFVPGLQGIMGAGFSGC